MENSDGLDYSTLIENGQSIAAEADNDDKHEICYQCQQQRNFCNSIDEEDAAGNGLTNFRGCRRSQQQQMNENMKGSQINNNRKFSREIKANCRHESTITKSVNVRPFRSTARVAENFVKANWKHLKEEFTKRLINIPDDTNFVTQSNCNHEHGIKYKVDDILTSPNYANENNCPHKENDENNDFVNQSYDALGYCERRSNAVDNDANKSLYNNHEPILAPIQSICSRIDEY